MVLDTVLRSSLVLMIGFAIAVTLRRQPAALRHWILAASIVLAAAQPVITRLLPSWTISPSLIEPFEEAAPASPRVSTTTAFEILTEQPRSMAPARRDVAGVAMAIWIGGVVLGLATLLSGVVWLLWLSRRSAPAGSVWRDAEATVRARLGLAAPVRIRITRHPALLVTWGVINPVILLPADADTWADERVRLVLAHEMAHLARRDWLMQLAAECARAIYWFNPLFWLASARLRQESEHASDDIVLDLGFPRTAYAMHLVDLARVFSLHGRTWLPAPSMARPSTLERRVRTMLNPHTNRQPVSLTRRIAMVALLLTIALPIASAQTLSAPSGTVVDPSGLPLPNAAVRLTGVSGAPVFEATTDRTGAFQFPVVPSGEYMLSSRLPGFSTLRQRVQIGGATTLPLQLQVGTLSETVTVRGGPGPQETSPRAAASPMPVPPPCGSTSVGGNLKPPKKLLMVNPKYRESWFDAGVQGSVLLQARIGTDGKISSVEVVSPSHPELEDEALAAISQWEFSPTYLNCEAVEVRIFVTVAFTAER